MKKIIIVLVLIVSLMIAGCKAKVEDFPPQNLNDYKGELIQIGNSTNETLTLIEPRIAYIYCDYPKNFSEMIGGKLWVVAGDQCIYFVNTTMTMEKLIEMNSYFMRYKFYVGQINITDPKIDDDIKVMIG